MAMKSYKSGDTEIWFKIIRGRPHIFFRDSPNRNQVFNLGIAFRTFDAPIGYLPFYDPSDFNLSGDVSFKERLLSRLPVNMSAPASPHTLLIGEAAGDVEFLGAGEADFIDIGREVRKELLGHAMRCASGAFVDGVMVALGGPAIRGLIDQLTKSSVKQFLLSKGVSAAAKSHLKSQGGFDVQKFLSVAP